MFQMLKNKINKNKVNKIAGGAQPNFKVLSRNPATVQSVFDSIITLLLLPCPQQSSTTLEQNFA